MLEINEFDTAHFLSAPKLLWQAAVETTKGKLDLLTYIAMLLMTQKGVIGGICHAIYWYAKASNKYMKDYDKNKELSYHKYWDLNSLCCWVMPQKLSQKLGWTNIWI